MLPNFDQLLQFHAIDNTGVWVCKCTENQVVKTDFAMHKKCLMLNTEIIYHCKEECPSFIQKQTKNDKYANHMQIMLMDINEVLVKKWISHRAQRNIIWGAR